MQSSGIEWTDRVWNPVRGCSRVSEGCRNCYAERLAARFSSPGMWGHGFAESTVQGGRWTGAVRLLPEKLPEPLSLRKPSVIFVNSTSDLFHENLAAEEIAAAFGAMGSAADHTFVVLTKRPEIAAAFFGWVESAGGEQTSAWDICQNTVRHLFDEWPLLAEAPPWPLPNVALGVSVEDQRTADERIPRFMELPAATHFVSAEPLLGSVDLTRIKYLPWTEDRPEDRAVYLDYLTGGRSTDTPWHLDGVIVGGESGPGARPMNPEWARRIRDDSQEAGVPFFFKQWGEYADYDQLPFATRRDLVRDSQAWDGVRRVGKKRAGRLLDGRTHNDLPWSLMLGQAAATGGR